jgi:hypothetical protein
LKFILLAAFLGGIIPIWGENWNPKISIKNGSTGKKGQAESIKLIALQGGMVPIGEFSNKEGDFELGPIQVAEGVPILIQAIYKGVNYNKMIPPVPEMRSQIQEIIVYEKTDSTKGLLVQSLIQITRVTDALRIHKVYLLKNTTNFSIENSDRMQVFIPKEAKEISGQLTQGKKGMPIPLSLQEGTKGKKIDRAILPGESSLQISYTIDSKKTEKTTLEELPILEDSNSLVVFLKPEDMNLEVQGAKSTIIQESDAPEGMGVVSIEFEKEKSFSLVVSGGEPFVEQVKAQQRVVNGNIFTTPEKSLYGVLAMLAIFFSLSFIFVYKKSI